MDKPNGQYRKIPPFGHHVYGETLGGAWLALVKAVLEHGTHSYDEERGRLALQNVRIKSETQIIPDKLMSKYGSEENLAALISLTFDKGEMYDFDIVPSFTPGAKSYYQRIQDGKMIDFVIKRLTRFPESKKAVIVFPTYDDYKAVLESPTDDYLPCIVSVQFRLLDKRDGFLMNTIFNARSIDAYQKAHGNFAAIAMLSHKIAKELTRNLGREVICGPLDGLITDAHCYSECFDEAREMIKRAEKNGDCQRS